MDISGRPLLDTSGDQPLVVARPELEVLRRAVENELNVLLVGERGAGATTLLRRLAYELRHDAARPAVFVDAGPSSDARTLLELVRYRVERSPAGSRGRDGHGRANGTRRPDVSRRPDPGETEALLDLLGDLGGEAGDPRTTLLVDGIPSPEIAHTLFGRLRDELWQLPFTWVVAARAADRGAYLEPPADAFFDRVVELGPLDEQQQKELLERRLGRPAGELEELIAGSGGNPRRLLDLVRGVVGEGRTARDVLDARAARESAAAALGRSASMLVAELDASGPASASDPDLLERLGWTRERAVQVFGDLEDAGVVRAASVRGRRGRPRKVYSLRDGAP